MERAENAVKGGCPRRDSTECKGEAEARSVVKPETGETESRKSNLLEMILDRDNLNRAYKRVKANKGAPGIDGMTVEEALPWLKEHGREMIESILSGKYKATPVRRKEIPKPNGGVRKLGIPTVKDRIVQQAIAQVLTPMYEPKFSEGSYGYRAGRSAQDAILKIKGYAEEGYEWAVMLDLSKYFDTLNHEKLINLLRETVKDETVCLLSKLRTKEHIDIELTMDELDATAAEQKATYEGIKSYVKKTTGLTVSSLYIAQVKAKCGIKEHICYNKPKTDDAKVPQCPPDKENAIRAALRHFAMI